VAAIVGLLVAAAGIYVAYTLYAKAARDPLPTKLGGLSTAMRNRFYFDELYEMTVIPLHDAIAALAGWFDRWIIDGFCVGLVRGGTDLIGRTLRMVQTGNIQAYAFLFALGVALVLWLALK
jgi:NADH-quinone oxidoreductase subunit L